MKTFKDLKFKPHPASEGLCSELFFPNGYGVSVIRYKLPIKDFSFSNLAVHVCKDNDIYASYTSDETEWELAIFKGNKKESYLCYDTPITNDVIGHLKDKDVTRVMKQVQALPKVKV